jgi:hypothetical protein
MAFATAIIRPPVRADGSLAAHRPHCSYTNPETKNQIPRPECNCINPIWNPHTGRYRLPPNIEIGGLPITSIHRLVMHYYSEWIQSDISYFECAAILFEGTTNGHIDRLYIYNRMRDFAMKSLGTGWLPEITDEDITILTEYLFSRQ